MRREVRKSFADSLERDIQTLMWTIAVAPLLIAAGAAPAAVPADVLAARIMDLAEKVVRSGFALRDRYGLPKHQDGPAIYLDWSNKHDVTLETSVILWKDREGHWQRDDATELSPGLLKMGPRLESHYAGQLSEEDEQSLERLIRARKLFRQPTPSIAQIGYGPGAMEIRTRYGHTTVVSYAGQSGPVAEITKIATSRPGSPPSTGQ